MPSSAATASASSASRIGRGDRRRRPITVSPPPESVTSASPSGRPPTSGTVTSDRRPSTVPAVRRDERHVAQHDVQGADREAPERGVGGLDPDPVRVEPEELGRRARGDGHGGVIGLEAGGRDPGGEDRGCRDRQPT